MKSIIFFTIISLQSIFTLFSQTNDIIWNPDNGDGTYKNPIIYADYSDPDVIKVGDSFYMTSSSFNCMPGLPILQSYDLVNWKIISHAVEKLEPASIYDKPQHGNGVWAPSIRYHNNEFYIYYGDPDFGIYLVKSKKIEGPWSNPILVFGGKGLIDPCPLWDDDGNNYLIHAWAKSRAGIKSILTINRLNSEGTKVIDNGVLVFDGHLNHPTIEGPKIYKRKEYYYILAPAGGVKTGWQLALRSKNIYGPYDEKIVLHQGNTTINGPHQGAWVETDNNESWFIHFQDMDAYGRVVLLEPVQWVNDWPLIGINSNNDNSGEPVKTYKKPNIQKGTSFYIPQSSDEFNSSTLGLQWQWQANSRPNWAFPSPLGFLRLNAVQIPDSTINFWNLPNLLLQKFPAPEFKASTKLTFTARSNNEEAGMIVMGTDYESISVIFKNGNYYLSQTICKNAEYKTKPIILDSIKLNSGFVYLQIKISTQAVCQFSYSNNGIEFHTLDKLFEAKPGKWIGAKIGLYCIGKTKTNDAGTVYFDWFRLSK